MLFDKDKIRLSYIECGIVLVTILYFIGIRTWFQTCAVSENVMSSHWAWMALKLVSSLMVVMAVIHGFVSDEKMKMGMDVVLAGVEVLALLIPDTTIHLCMMADMRCHTHMQPATLVFFIILLVLTVADLIYYVSDLNRKKHRR